MSNGIELYEGVMVHRFFVGCHGTEEDSRRECYKAWANNRVDSEIAILEGKIKVAEQQLDWLKRTSGNLKGKTFEEGYYLADEMIPMCKRCGVWYAFHLKAKEWRAFTFDGNFGIEPAARAMSFDEASKIYTSITPLDERP